jgi:protein TonB
VQEPEEVWKENKNGTTVVEARVNARGKIIGTKVHKSSGYTGMDAEAMLAVSRVRWKPARKQGMPIDSVVRVTIDFSTSISAK